MNPNDPVQPPTTPPAQPPVEPNPVPPTVISPTPQQPAAPAAPAPQAPVISPEPATVSAPPPVNPTVVTPNTEPPAPITSDQPVGGTPPQPGVMPAGYSGYPQPPATTPPFVPPAKPGVPGLNRRLILLIFGGICSLGVVIVLVLVLLSVLGGNISYSASDLVSIQTSHYSVSYPKQWKDVSSNQALLNSSGALNSGFNDTKVYAYKVAKNNKYAQTIFFAGDQVAPFTDSELSQALQNPTEKQQIVSELSPSFSASDVGCKSIANKGSSFQFNTSKFILQFSYSYDCTPPANQGESTAPYHVDSLFGVQNGYLDGAIISTQESDWQRNHNFYEQDLLGSLQPK